MLKYIIDIYFNAHAHTHTCARVKKRGSSVLGASRKARPNTVNDEREPSFLAHTRNNESITMLIKS